MPDYTYLNIAAFHLRLASVHTICLDAGYGPFTSSPTEHDDIRIECFAMPDSIPFDTDTLLFEAANRRQLFYRIYQHQDALGFIIYNQVNNKIQQYALLNREMTDWKIWSNISKHNELDPLRYPMGPILMHYMTMKYDAVMMHASCVFDGKKGRLFSGFSGVGKSTMSRIWHQNGALVVNDDRLIIRQLKDGRFWTFNTPMYYADQPKSAPLEAIYLIRHSPENIVRILKGATALSRVMAFSIQNNFDKTFIQQRIDLFGRICTRIPVCELGFVPDATVIDFIKNHEQQQG